MLRTNLKIALVSSATHWGDCERVLWTLGIGLINRGHQVLWVCNESSKLFQQVVAHGFAACPLPNPTKKPRAFLSLRRACVAHGVQIMLSNDSQARTWGSIAMVGKLGVKHIQYKHNFKLPYSTVPYHWMLERLVCVSTQVRKACVEYGIAQDKISTIEIGVETPQLEKWKERFWACELLGISQQTPLFCWIGEASSDSVTALKNHVQLIEAANHLRWYMNVFCIVVTCSQSQAAELRRMVIKYSLHEHFRFVGYEGSERWICASDVLIQDETNSGYSLAAIEAQLMGTKIVTSGSKGRKEQLAIPSLEAATQWHCDQDDPSALANAMGKAATTSEQQTHRTLHSISINRKRFDPFRMVQNFELLFCKTLGIGEETKLENNDGQLKEATFRRAG